LASSSLLSPRRPRAGCLAALLREATSPPQGVGRHLRGAGGSRGGLDESRVTKGDEGTGWEGWDLRRAGAERAALWLKVLKQRHYREWRRTAHRGWARLCAAAVWRPRSRSLGGGARSHLKRTWLRSSTRITKRRFSQKRERFSVSLGSEWGEGLIARLRRPRPLLSPWLGELSCDWQPRHTALE
jgi:hypothetical protein